MPSAIEIDEENGTKGGMWMLDQKLDQPMEEEAGKLRNVFREKVLFFCNLCFFFFPLLLFVKVWVIIVLATDGLV